MIGTAEAAVDHDQASAAFQRRFTLHRAHGHVPVDDVAGSLVQPEFCQNRPLHPGVVVEDIIRILRLVVGGFIGYKQPLKGGHAGAAIQRRRFAAPQIPQKVHPALPLVAALRGIVAPPGTGIAIVHQVAPRIAVVFKGYHRKAAAFGQRHGTMEHQISVFDFVNAALGKQELHMVLQLFALFEVLHQMGNNVFFLLGQLGGVLGVHGREIHIQHGVAFSLNLHGAVPEIDLAQQFPVLHLKVRVPVDDHALHLEHHHGDGLMHPGHTLQPSFVVRAACLIHMGHKPRNVAVLIHRLGQIGQPPQIDVVPFFQHLHVVVGQRGFHNGQNADGAACRRAHPDHIVVAPLNVHRMVRHQLIQNDVRPGAAVKQIAHNVQLIHGQPLDQRTHCNDKVIRTPGCGDAAEDLPVVHILIVILKMRVQQLIQNVLIALG